MEATHRKIQPKEYASLLVTYLKPHRSLAYLLAGLILGNIALQLINPQFIRSFIDSAQAGVATGLLVRLGMWFLGLALLQQVISVLASYASENLAWKTTNNLRNDLTEHCLQLDLSFHNAHSPGEMIERIDGDVTALSNFFSRFVIELLGNAVLLVGILVLLFLEDWRAGVALSSFAALSMFIMIRFRDIAVPYWAAERQASADFYGFLEERLAGTEDIRANGAEAYVMRHFYRLMREMLRRSLRAMMMINLLLNSMLFLFATGTAVALATGASLYQAKAITIGSVYLIFYYTTMLERPINSITHQIDSLQKAGAGIVRMRQIMDTPSRIQEPAGPVSAGLAQTEGGRVQRGLEVLFQDVTFGYHDSPPQGGKETVQTGESSNGSKEIVLQGLTFRLRPGTVLGLLGRTGSGKTTLARLLFRFYDPDAGSIRVSADGASGLVDLRDLPLAALRKQIGLVTQNIQLFHANVRDNLTFFEANLPDEQIIQVIDDLGMGKWFRTLPQGLDTDLEAGGGGLSAGEAQLLAFARVFLKDPRLVVLDEASSRLDPATETLIDRAVDRLVAGRTAIIIAHRLGTVQKADEILILEQGQILEHGDRLMLAADPGSRFYQLLESGLEEVLA